MTTGKEDDDWMNAESQPKRNPKGQFGPGQSGNRKGRPRKTPMMALEVAQSLMRAAQFKVSIKGKRRKMTALEATHMQLAIQAANGEKNAPERLLKLLSQAARVIELYMTSRAAALGRYIRDKEHGNAKPLTRQEAHYLQQIADEVGMDIKIEWEKPKGDAPAFTQKDIDNIVNNEGFKRYMSNRGSFLKEDEMVRQVLYYDRLLNQKIEMIM